MNDQTPRVNQEILNALGNEIATLIETYKKLMPVYEVGHALIHPAVSMLLCTAPSELIAIKTIMACIETGIASYERDHKD